MAIENDFLRARTQIAAKIQKLEGELKYWREELQAFDRVETTMRRLGDAANGNGAGSNGKSEYLELVPDTANEGAIRSSDDSSDSSASTKRGDLTRRVLGVVLDGKGIKLSATQVERSILQTGFKPTGKHFGITVAKTLNRLADRALIERSRYAGHVKFQSKSDRKDFAQALVPRN